MFPHLSSLVTLSALVVIVVEDIVGIGVGSSVGKGGSDGRGSWLITPAKARAKTLILFVKLSGSIDEE